MGNDPGEENRHRSKIAEQIFEEECHASLASRLLFLRHKQAYLFAGKPEFCSNKTVLDYGCGSGYGSYYLAGRALAVKGVDLDPEVIGMCRRKYRSANLSFEVIDSAGETGFISQQYDLIVSFQVIEHISDVTGYLGKLKNLLTDQGLIILTTPNRRYRLYPFQRPVNPYHLREYSLRTLARQLRKVFADREVTILGITGTKEMNRIEYRRVNKSLIHALLSLPLKRMICYLAPGLIARYRVARRPETKSLPDESGLFESFTEDDYQVISDKLDTSLDFLVLLRKNLE